MFGIYLAWADDHYAHVPFAPFAKLPIKGWTTDLFIFILVSSTSFKSTPRKHRGECVRIYLGYSEIQDLYTSQKKHKSERART